MDLHVDGITANLAEPAPAQKHMSSSFRQIDAVDVMHNCHGRSKLLIAAKKNSGNFSSTVDGAIFGANATDFAADRDRMTKFGLPKIAAIRVSVTHFESCLDFTASADAKSA